MNETTTDRRSYRATNESLLSICVPTYNREHLLDEFLERLAAFTRLNYEVVISDNASTDGTAQIVEKWRPRLKGLYYLRQEATLTPEENTCAVCNAARGDYIFRMSDDDLMLEDGLLVAKEILDEDPTCAAVYGSWHMYDYNFEKIEHRNDHENTRIRRDQLLEMYYRFWTVELPMFRRELFQRHMLGYVKQLPLDFHAAGRFLHYGDLVFIPDLIVKVRYHPGQESHELYNTRMLQTYFTDYELFLGEVPDINSQKMLSAFLQKAINMYLAAVRRALSHHKFLEARGIMKRAMAYRVKEMDLQAINFEKAYLPAVIADYIFELCRLDPAIKRLQIEHSHDGTTFFPFIERKLGERLTVKLIEKAELLTLLPDDDALVIVQDSATMAQRLEVSGTNPARHRCLDDIVEVCSLF